MQNDSNEEEIDYALHWAIVFIVIAVIVALFGLLGYVATAEE